MAGGAIVGNRLAVRAGVRTIVAAEASGKIGVAKVVGVHSPGDFHIRKKAVELLKVDYPDRETAQKQIVDGINNYYRTTYPDIYNSKRALIEQSADNVAKIYLRNIFPDMKVTWGVHPNNLGHNDFPGCFRCHDGSHTSGEAWLDNLTIRLADCAGMGARSHSCCRPEQYRYAKQEG